jgi:KaiC/GvpD/RAD55 family RecA-like ATPase
MPDHLSSCVIEDHGTFVSRPEDLMNWQAEMEWEVHNKLTAPNGMGLREMLKAMKDEGLRAHLVEIEYSYLLQEERKTPEEASRVLLYSARGLLPPSKIRRSISRGMLLAKRPESEKQFKYEAKGIRHRVELEQALRHRNNLIPVTFGIDELDALISGGITAGEVLHIVGGEGGLKTSLLLHILCNYIDKGGQALFFSLDMPPETIELRRLMRFLDCGRERAKEHVKYDSEEYRRAREFLEEQDESLFVMSGPLGLGKMQAAILMSGADVVAIDYVSLVDGYRNELDAAREVTKAVRHWRKTWGITFILLSQMSRESKRDAVQGGTGGHGIGGSSLEQLVDYELELIKDEPLGYGGNPRLIATLRKNRAGQSGVSFEVFPCFPSLAFSSRAQRVERERKRKPLFSDYLN